MKSSSLVDIGRSPRADIEIEVSTLDAIFGQLGIKLVDFMIIQLNGAEIEAIEGLKRTEVYNLSIAARYKRTGKAAYNKIVPILHARDYNVLVEDEEFIYASKNRELF